jgi:DNA repair protein RadC
MMALESNTTTEKPVHYRIPVYSIALVRERTLSQLQRPQIRTTADAAHVLSTYLADADREDLVVMLLNSKHRIIGIHTVSVGSLTSSLAHPREAMKAAILANAAAFILCHNHPSGDPTPSNEDHALTKRMYAASELLGVQLLDHIIIGDAGRWYSFQDEGALVQTTLWRSHQ